MNNKQIQELISLYSIGGVLRVWEYTRAVEDKVLEAFSGSDPMGYQAYLNNKGIQND